MRNLSSLFILAYVFFWSNYACAQLSGIKTVGGGASPDYATINDAITALNTNGVGIGGVTFNVAPGHTETASNLVINTTSSDALSPVVFQKAGPGNNPLITAAAGSSSSTDGIIKIAGTDYLTFDGIDLLDPTTNTSTSSRMEWGYAILKGGTTNGAQHITIRNCTITLQKAYTNSTGIYAANHLVTSTSSLSISSTSGINSHLDIYGNNITNCYQPVYVIGSSNATYYDDSIRIGSLGGNVITNFGGTSTATQGIYLRYFKYAEVMNDSINGGSGTSRELIGIDIDNSTGSSVQVSNNYIQTNFSPSSYFGYGIRCAAGSAGSTVLISNNRIQNCTMSGSISDWFGIWVATLADVVISGNTLSGNTASASIGSIYMIYSDLNTPVLSISNNVIRDNTPSPSSSKAAYGIYAEGRAMFSGNIIHNNTITGSSSKFYALYANAGGTINDNKIDSNSAGTSSSSACYGIYTTGGSAEIYRNDVHSLSTGGKTLEGITLDGRTGVVYQVYQNKIYDLRSSYNSAVTNGIIQNEASEAIIYNNLIASLASGPSSTTTNGINGINISSSGSATVSRLYHNTVYLNATSSGGSNCIYLHSAVDATVINNILVNLSANGSTLNRAAVALKRSSSAYTTYNVESDNNFFNVGTTAANRYVYTDGSTSHQTISQYRSYAASRDQSSLSAPISFASINGGDPDFLKPVDTTFTESTGKIITGITGDYASATSRQTYPVPGQVNGGGALPDIGAYELDLVFIDNIAPAISFTPFDKSLINVSKQVDVTITDASGVNVNFGTSPRIYFRKSSNSNALAGANNSTADGWKYVEAFQNPGYFTFYIDYTLLYATGSVAAGDTIEFFVVAQDNFSTPNVGVNGAVLNAAAASVALTASNFPVVASNSYVIQAGAVPSYITVGSGGTYTSLTQAGGVFEAINNGVLANDVTVVVLSDLTETGAVALRSFTEEGTGNYTVRIIPATNTNVTISGTRSSGGLINLVDAGRVDIDGSVGGFGRYLTFINHSLSANSAAILLTGTAAGGCSNISIKNCTIGMDTAYVTNNAALCIGGTLPGTGTGSQQGIGNRNIVIAGNHIIRSYHGILINGSGALPADSVIISGNEIGSDNPTDYVGSNGLYMRGLKRGQISGNRIFNIVNDYSIPLSGITLDQDISNTTITQNRISEIVNLANASIAVFGIIAKTATISDITLTNNTITRVLGQGANTDITTGPVGIYLYGGVNYNILNNSVVLSGNRLDNTATNAYTACLYARSTVSGIKLRNNVLKNVMTSSNAGGPGSNFVYVSNANNVNAFSHLSNNLYYAASATPGMATALALTNTTQRSDLNDWKAFATADQNSLWGQPGYLYDSIAEPDLTNPHTWNINGRGYPLAEVSADITNYPRSTQIQTGSVDIGAFEVTPGVPPPNAGASAAPAAGTTTYYTLAGDTLAAIEWQTGSAVPASIAVKYYSGTYPPASSGQLYMDAYWDIEAAPSTGLDYNITLYYKKEALYTVNEANMIMAKKDNATPWNPFTSTTVLNTAAQKMSVNGLTSFSYFTGTDASNPLPVTLLSFTAKRDGSSAVLNWTTVNEKNCAGFEVERAANGRDFEPAGYVKAMGQGSTVMNYRFTDANAIPAGQVAYRLKTVDRNGSFSYSAVVVLQAGESRENPIRIYPNPFSRYLVVTVPDGESNTLEMRDINGRVVFTAALPNGGTHYVNLPENLARGVYFVQEQAGGKITRLVKTE